MPQLIRHFLRPKSNHIRGIVVVYRKCAQKDISVSQYSLLHLSCASLFTATTSETSITTTSYHKLHVNRSTSYSIRLVPYKPDSEWQRGLPNRLAFTSTYSNLTINQNIGDVHVGYLCAPSPALQLIQHNLSSNSRGNRSTLALVWQNSYSGGVIRLCWTGKWTGRWNGLWNLKNTHTFSLESSYPIVLCTYLLTNKSHALELHVWLFWGADCGIHSHSFTNRKW